MSTQSKFPYRIDSSWTLFLDRDGVINIDRADYVYVPEQFIFAEGALEALNILARVFSRIVVVTNQKGVGQGLMSLRDLEVVHEYMMNEITKAGGRIDLVLFSTGTDTTDPFRKPNTGMAYRAQEISPEIDFSKSVMIGDKHIDIQWGQAIGAWSCWIENALYADTPEKVSPDQVFTSLKEAAEFFQRNSITPLR